MLVHSNDPQANVVEQSINGQWSLGYQFATKQYLFGVNVDEIWHKAFAHGTSGLTQWV